MHLPRIPPALRAPVLAIALLLTGGGADAQPSAEPEADPAPLGPARILSLDLGLQVINDAFMNQVDFRQANEPGAFRAHYDVTKHHSFGGAIARRLTRRLGYGVAVSHVSEPTTARIDADVPHPYFFGFPRRADGDIEGLNRREIGVHFQGHYWWTVLGNLRLRAALGPSIFIARQELVSGIETAEVDDNFDRVALADHRSRAATAGSLGLHFGIDGNWFVTERLGLGFNVRYSRGTATVRLGLRSSTPLELGGVHVGGGLRMAF